MTETRSTFTSPSEFWNGLRRHWGFDTARNVAFRYIGRKPVSEMDEIELTQIEAEKIYKVGQEQSIMVDDIALPMFSLHFFIDDDKEDSELSRLLQPQKPYKDTLIYGVYCDFIIRKEYVLMAVSVDETHNDSAGIVELAVLLMAPDKRGGWTVGPLDLCEESAVFTDNKTLKEIGHMLGNFFIGIQYKMRFKPDQVHIRHEKVPSEARERKAANSRTRVVKVRRVISFQLDDEEVTNRDALPDERDERIRHSYTLPCWGVCGHFRHYKSGKVVWIHPYKKGKDRNKEGVYCGKQYQFIEEDSQG